MKFTENIWRINVDYLDFPKGFKAIEIIDITEKDLIKYVDWIETGSDANDAKFFLKQIQNKKCVFLYFFKTGKFDIIHKKYLTKIN